MTKMTAAIDHRARNVVGDVHGLPVSGYRPQSPEAIASVNALKEIEEHVLRLLDELATDTMLEPDKKWLATGRTDIEKGFMAVNRSVFKPGRVGLDPGSAEPERGWVLERADSSPATPLYYAPAPGGHGSQWSVDHSEAVRFAREIDASRLGIALAMQVRVCEHQWG